MLDDSEIGTEAVHVGSVVTVRVKGKKSDTTYRLVGSTEADPLNGCISDESPIGKALIGHSAGDEIEVETPGGIVVLTIQQIAK